MARVCGIVHGARVGRAAPRQPLSNGTYSMGFKLDFKSNKTLVFYQMPSAAGELFEIAVARIRDASP